MLLLKYHWKIWVHWISPNSSSLAKIFFWVICRDVTDKMTWQSKSDGTASTQTHTIMLVTNEMTHIQLTAGKPGMVKEVGKSCSALSCYVSPVAVTWIWFDDESCLSCGCKNCVRKVFPGKILMCFWFDYTQTKKSSIYPKSGKWCAKMPQHRVCLHWCVNNALPVDLFESPFGFCLVVWLLKNICITSPELKCDTCQLPVVISDM